MNLDSYQTRLRPLCRKYHVERLYAFGSVLTDRFTDDSDIDLIVALTDWMAKDAVADFFDLRNALEALFNRPVDLMAEQPIRNPVLRRSVESTKQLIYERAN